jgi:pyroglutamyl-peptidase
MLNRKKLMVCGLLTLVLTIGISQALLPSTASIGKPLTVLLVGYGWYSGIPEGQVNIAEIVATTLDRKMIIARDEGGRIAAIGKVYGLVVPVEWYGAWPPVEAAIRTLKPNIIIAVGCSPGAPGLRVEAGGVNWMYGTSSAPEAMFKNETIEPNGPPYRLVNSSVPTSDMVIACLKNGIPAYLGKVYADSNSPIGWSSTTGRYLCNFMTYMLAKYAGEHPEVKAGFVHIPTLPEYVSMDIANKLPDYDLTKAPSSTMQKDLIVEGIRICIETVILAYAEG